MEDLLSREPTLSSFKGTCLNSFIKGTWGKIFLKALHQVCKKKVIYQFEKVSKDFHRIGPWTALVQQSQCPFMYLSVCLYIPFSCNLFLGLSLALRLWQDQPGSRLLAGSNRQQTVGKINQAADRGDGPPFFYIILFINFLEYFFSIFFSVIKNAY